jgi:hypothetical protein
MVEPSREAAKRYMQSSRGAKKVQLSTQNDFNRVQFCRNYLWLGNVVGFET